MLVRSLSLLLVLVGVCFPADPDVSDLLKDLRAGGSEGANSARARAAWDRLVAHGPEVLPTILEAMDTADTVAANWMRSAFDRIADRALSQGGKGIDTERLLTHVRDAKHQGRARRLALELLDQVRPGTRSSLLPGWLDDPEFRYDAVQAILSEVDQLKGTAPDRALAQLRRAFQATRDLPQSQAVAARLRALKENVSVADHFGFLRDWYVIGPFDAGSMKGFATVYPPEKGVDLNAKLPGQDSKTLTWKRFTARETPAGKHVALVNLVEPLGNADDAVAYAWTQIHVEKEQEVELRGAADDNFTIWLNGKRVFGFEEYRNGVRFDRHRVRVTLQKGVNSILVKVCQAPVDPSNREPNWEFLLRTCDREGKGLLFPSALPADK
jgi:hypothetical protein